MLAPGVASASDLLQVGDDVIVVDPDRRAVAVGQARMEGRDMVDEDYGVCVKVRHHRRTGDTMAEPGPIGTWDDVIEANRAHMERMVDKGKDFVTLVAEEEDLSATFGLA